MMRKKENEVDTLPGISSTFLTGRQWATAHYYSHALGFLAALRIQGQSSIISKVVLMPPKSAVL